MSRPSSYHDAQRYEEDPFDPTGPALPLFNHHQPPSIPQIHTNIAPNGGSSGGHLPPSAGGAFHQTRHSIAHTNNISSPYSAHSPLSAGPPPSARHHRQGSMSSALPYTIPYPGHLTEDLMMPPPAASTSFGSLARSASLGRRKDPYAYSSDDVESGLGNMDMGETSWPGYNAGRPVPAQRDVVMSPNRPSSQTNPMNPPPIPSHALRPQQTRYDSGGSSPSRASYSGQGQHETFPNPYVPRASDPGPSVTAAVSQQYPDYRRPPAGSRMPSSSTYSQHSPSSDQNLSPYLRPEMQAASHSPLPNPYELSPNFPGGTLPPSPLATAKTWSRTETTIPQSPPYTRSLSSQAYPASQPVTPAGKYEMAPPRGLPSRGLSGSLSRLGFREVRAKTDLRPVVTGQSHGRRADPDASGKYLSPLKCLTTTLHQTYTLCNPNFRYESSDNPRRVLTKPSKPVHNDGADNEDWDYILYVNDVLGGEGGRDRYLILDVLGQGTFGQVVKCQNMRSHDIVAVKVVKNKPAYLNQSKMEVAILDLLNREYDPNDQHHILRMLDSFTHKSHLCLVFECLSSNLYELIKQNQFKGLSTQLVKVFTQQLLECLAVLKDARLIHCDLKPENILLKSLQSPQIKIIDFGSACHEMQTVYTYIQSRFYRSPEVLLGLPYSTSIDMWSLGCIVVELFLGLPIFPGTSEYNQVSRIVDMLGNPPSHLLEVGKQTHEFFNLAGVDAYGKKQYVLKPMEQYATEHRTKEQPSKQYFKQTQLKDIIMEYPMSKKNPKQSEIDKEMANRRSFVDFVQGLLNLDPIQRWSPQQAAKHPFITGEKFTGAFQPSTGGGSKKTQSQPHPVPAETPAQQTPSSAKKYGGLVQSPSAQRGQRIYSDAAAYNQQLASHQAYTAQVQSSGAARNQPFSPGYDLNQAQNAYAQRVSSHSLQSQRPPQWQMPPPPQPNFNQRGQSQAVAASSSSTSVRNNASMAAAQTNPPPNSYYPPSRNRANTINQMDAIPPALARLTHFGAPDPSGTRNLTPILNRGDDPYKEWERRQGGHSKKSSLANATYPQLEYLQEQAELAAMGGSQGWMLPGAYGPIAGHRQSHSHTLSGSHYQMQPPIGASPQQPTSADYRRSAASEYDPPLPSSSSSRSFLPAYPPPAATSAPNSAGFDAFDARDSGMGMMYTPLQPNQSYQPYAHTGHNQRASYSGPYHNVPTPGQQQIGANNPFAQNQPPTSPRYRRNPGYGS